MTGLELRLIAYGLLAAGLVGGWFYVGHLQDEAREAKALRSQYAALIAITRERERNNAENQRGYLAELERLRAGRAGGARVVRVCNDAAAGAASGRPAGESDGAAAAAGGVPPQARPDLGPSLYAEADRADELSAQLRALQDWVRRNHPLEQ